ncbi:MAG: cytochrome d ubiquinol oxidase subunit II [Ignavibacteriaceae bacterium]
MDLNTIWFLLIGILIMGYAVLDGFDLGVGVLYLFTKDETAKRAYLNSIGPVWDGNEVWLLTGGGALFAAFPVVYATVFSGFYIPFMLLLAALIFRAVSFEFRGKVSSTGWKRLWDYLFGIGSLLPSILFGVAIGNILRGLPIDIGGNYVGTFLDLLNPYSILVGLVSLSFFAMHGSIYLMMKSEGSVKDKVLPYVNKLWMAFVLLYALASFFTFFEAPFQFNGLLINPLFWVLFILLLISIALIPVFVKANKFFKAIIFSSLTIISMTGLAALSLFPRLVPSNIDLDFSLTIYNSSSSQTSLTAMLYIALIGMPIVIAYTIFVYRVFKGKVEITKDSY